MFEISVLIFLIILIAPIKLGGRFYFCLNRGTAIVCLYLFDKMPLKLRLYRKDDLFFLAVNGHNKDLNKLTESAKKSKGGKQKKKSAKTKKQISLKPLLNRAFDQVKIRVRLGLASPDKTALAAFGLATTLDAAFSGIYSLKNGRAEVEPDFFQEGFLTDIYISKTTNIIKIIVLVFCILFPKHNKEKKYG